MKYIVQLDAISCLSVEVEASENATFEELSDLAFDEADISEAEPSVWDGVSSIEKEDGTFIDEPKREKTLFLIDLIGEESFFCELEGNYSKYNDVYIGSNGDSLENELDSLLFVKGEFNLSKIESPTKDWNYFVKCGVL